MERRTLMAMPAKKRERIRNHLGRLPAEVFCLVAEDDSLSTRDLAALAATCRKCYFITNPILYQKHIKKNSGHALRWAVERKRFTTIRRFLQNGADINNDTMFSAYMEQQEARDPADVTLGWNSYSVFTPLALAAAHGLNSMVSFLLDHGADIEKPGKGLCPCCEGENVPELNFPPMKERGTTLDANWLMEDTAGMWFTPLHIALCRGHESTAMILLERGANSQVTCPCHDGPWNALHTATRMNHQKIIKYMLDNKLVDINERGHKGLTPLLLAFYEEQYSLVDMYMDLGADINAVWASDQGEWTIFGMACLREDFERASNLLERGADPDLLVGDPEFGTEWTALGLLYGNLYGRYLRDSGWRYDINHARATRERRTLEEQIIQIKIDNALKKRVLEEQGKESFSKKKHQRRRSC